MRLGFWNRLAIVVGGIALVVVPTAVWFDMVKSHHESRNLSLELCQSIANRYLERDEYERYRIEDQKCWDERWNSPDTSPGWAVWWELVGGTAVALIVLYLLVWSAVATVKWVWRGRESAGTGGVGTPSGNGPPRDEVGHDD